jgi:F-type H+-transporting ATPase subunit gamma
MRAEIVSQAVGLGDKPELDRLIGAVKVQLDDFLAGRIDAV